MIDSYHKASGKQTTSSRLLEKYYHLATWSLFGKWEPKGNQNTGQLDDEWRICQLETIPKDWYTEGERHRS